MSLQNGEDGFDFTESSVVRALRPDGERHFKVGTATSDFQAEPLTYGKDGKPIIVTDWEMNIANKLAGKKSSIRKPQDAAQFPHFLPKKRLYAERSREIGQNMFRFSFDFGRLCPREDEFNSELMAEYVRLLGLIKAYGQEPMVTLYHWPMPRYLLRTDRNGNVKAGGWENPDVTKHFRFYAENVAAFLSNQDKVRNALTEEGLGRTMEDRLLADGLCKYFLTLNEPINIIIPPYVAGIFPPYKKSRFDLFGKIARKMVNVHDILRSEIKAGKFGSCHEGPKVGIAHNWTYFEGALKGVANRLINYWLTDMLERDGKYTDFLGLQYYFRMTVPIFSRKGRVYGEQPYFGDIYPRGIYECLKKMHYEYPGKDIFVTEFGFSDKSDLRRPYWTLETVRYVFEALRHGIPVIGMLIWSLAHNFEWDLGMTQRFGLFSEANLASPLAPSSGGIRSWEAWQAVAKAVADPSPESLRTLQEAYLAAKRQFQATLT